MSNYCSKSNEESRGKGENEEEKEIEHTDKRLKSATVRQWPRLVDACVVHFITTAIINISLFDNRRTISLLVKRSRLIIRLDITLWHQ